MIQNMYKKNLPTVKHCLCTKTIFLIYFYKLTKHQNPTSMKESRSLRWSETQPQSLSPKSLIRQAIGNLNGAEKNTVFHILYFIFPLAQS